MILNKNTSALFSGQGEGRAITPHILLWRSVIVRAIMDALDVDIHAWGKQRKDIVRDAKSWFNTKDTYFCDVCEHSNFEPSFIVNIFNKLTTANAKKLFKHKNLNKFLTHYLCSFH
tara:strand:- start:222 stop:569 length:348 start_codon:yes stop_codon:yes gene_type:complete